MYKGSQVRDKIKKKRPLFPNEMDLEIEESTGRQVALKTCIYKDFSMKYLLQNFLCSFQRA